MNEIPLRKRAPGLGRGLSSLLGEVANEAPVGGGGGIQSLPVSSIEPHPGQPRRHFDEEALSEQDLRAKLRAARQADDRDAMLINGAADSTHGTFVMVLDAGADAGMTEILFSVPHGDTAAEGG